VISPKPAARPLTEDEKKAIFLAGFVIVFGALYAMCAGLGSPSSKETYSSGAALSAQSPYNDPSFGSDHRDSRWASPAGDEVVRAAAEQYGMSKEEVRRRFNDELDRRGLAEWADRSAMPSR
jgi:hypothetical protein